MPSLKRKAHDKLSIANRQMAKFVDKKSCGEQVSKRRILFLTIKATKCMKTNKTRTKCQPNVRTFYSK